MTIKDTTPKPPQSIIGLDVKDDSYLIDADFEDSPRGGPASFVGFLLAFLLCFSCAWIAGMCE